MSSEYRRAAACSRSPGCTQPTVQVVVWLHLLRSLKQIQQQKSQIKKPGHTAGKGGGLAAHVGQAVARLRMLTVPDSSPRARLWCVLRDGGCSSPRHPSCGAYALLSCLCICENSRMWPRPHVHNLQALCVGDAELQQVGMHPSTQPRCQHSSEKASSTTAVLPQQAVERVVAFGRTTPGHQLHTGTLLSGFRLCWSSVYIPGCR